MEHELTWAVSRWWQRLSAAAATWARDKLNQSTHRNAKHRNYYRRLLQMDPRHALPRVSCCTQRWTSTVASIVNLNKLRPWGNDAVAWRKRQCKEQCQVHAGEEDHALWHVSSCIAARLVSYCYIQSSLLDCSSVSMFRSDIHRRNHVWQIIGLDLVWTADPPFFSSILPLLLPLIHVPPIPHPYSPRVQRINNSESQKGVVRWPCG